MIESLLNDCNNFRILFKCGLISTMCLQGDHVRGHSIYLHLSCKRIIKHFIAIPCKDCCFSVQATSSSAVILYLLLYTIFSNGSEKASIKLQGGYYKLLWESSGQEWYKVVKGLTFQEGTRKFLFVRAWSIKYTVVWS